MKISFHGQSCIKIKTEQYELLVDPFISGNTKCDLIASAEQPDYILLTHGHDDHVGDTIQIAKQSGATLICNVELATFLNLQGVEKVKGLHIGGKVKFDFGTIKLTQAFHGSSTVINNELINLGPPTGIIFSIEEKNIYHAGDTGLFSDMKLIGQLNPLDLAFLPIGDCFTMGPEEAKIAAEFLKPDIVVPIHYNTFSQIEQNPTEFIHSLPPSIKGKVMEIGDVVEI